MSDEALREAYQALLRSRTPDFRDACPSPDDLRAVVLREGDEASRLERLDHVMRCAACQPEFELLRSAATAARQSARFDWRPLAVAATIALAVGLTFVMQRPSATGAAVERGAGSGPRLEFPVGSVRAADARRLVWHPVPSAMGYDVEVTTPQGEVRLATTTTDTTQALPSLTAGEELRWWVRARLLEGDQASEVARVIVLP